MSIATILASIGICLYSLNFLLCITMIILMSVRMKSNVACLLICNTYFNALLLSCIMLMMYLYNLLGNLSPEKSFNDLWCRIRGYLTHVCFCAFYHSFLLQAIFRLFRIVFYRHKFLQSCSICLLSIVIQWIVSFLLILPNFYIFNDFQYLNNEYNCWIALENVRGLVMVTMTIYNNPLLIIFMIYMYIIRYTRRLVHIQRKREKDLIILKRIVILGMITVGIGLPIVIMVLIYIITGFVIPFGYHMQGLSISIGVLIGSISLILINPQIQQVFCSRRSHEKKFSEITRQNGLLMTQT